MKLSAAIITLDEEDNIAAAIGSVSWTDEIVVVDSGSTDRTIAIAKEMGARVIEQEWLGFGPQKQFAADACSHDWILSIDADEEVSPELKAEIRSLLSETPNANGYRIPRKTIYMGRPIKHSGWYPDYQLRLFQRSKGHWKAMVVHESVEMNAGSGTGELKSDLMHRSVESFQQHYRMIGERYAPLGAEQMRLDGKQTNPLKIAYTGPVTFVRTYLLKLGFLDGFAGFSIAMFASINAFLKHLILYELQTKSSKMKKG